MSLHACETLNRRHAICLGAGHAHLRVCQDRAPSSSQDLQAPTSEEAYQQEVLSCSLALAILGSACRLPELAGSDDMAERVPALVKARNMKVLGLPVDGLTLARAGLTTHCFCR